jgi:hypothetical protein
MKLTLAELKGVVREAIKLYHGSPYGGIKQFTDFKGRIPFVFFSPSVDTALEYTKVLNVAGRDPGGERSSQRTLYHVDVDFPESEIFDTGKNPEHAALYDQFRKEAYQKDPEDVYGILIWTPEIPGSSRRIELPPWSSIHGLFPFAVEKGFRAIWFSEGSQGPSLAVRIQDAGRIHISKTENVDD